MNVVLFIPCTHWAMITLIIPPPNQGDQTPLEQFEEETEGGFAEAMM
jgi:hypothetical protein